MAAKSIACREVGPVLIQVYPAHAPTNQEWDAVVQAAQKALARGCRKMLVVTAGWGPDVKQRATVREVVADLPVVAAVVSDAAVMRGLVTAMSWFNPRVRSFAFNNGAGVQDALKYLDVDGSIAVRAALEIRAMQREIGLT